MALKSNLKNPNQFFKSANVLGATSATLDVADAACLLTCSKVSVRLSLDLFFLWVSSCLPFLSSAATPGDLLKEWDGVGWAKREKQTEAEQVREKGKLKQKEIWLIKIQYSLCWSPGPRKLRSQNKLWGWKQPGANETALLEKALNESHGALGTDIFLNTKHHFSPPPWKWACSLGKQLVQHPLLCSFCLAQLMQKSTAARLPCHHVPISHSQLLPSLADKQVLEKAFLQKAFVKPLTKGS